mmetsp:Transcript_21904/g.35493  ORF Transcript_21904/g.35493 Transcript_21904/m.35493 type:complete len:239 (+) Transcript_21904:109-825(+)
MAGILPKGVGLLKPPVYELAVAALINPPGVVYEKLLMGQFASKTKAGRARTLLQRASRIVSSGHVEVPAWYEPMLLVAPASPHISAMKPKQIIFPEDKLIRAYYKRHPSARFVPVDFFSDEIHFVRGFALRQLEVQQSRKISEKAALFIVEAEAREEDVKAQEAKEAAKAYIAAGSPEEETPPKEFVRKLTPYDTLQEDHIANIQEEEEQAWLRTKSERQVALFENFHHKLAADRGRE